MKKILFLISFFIMGCSQNYNAKNLSLIEEKIKENNIEFSSKIKLGYCPTMQKYIDDIKNKNNIELVKLSSTQEVLANLRNNNIGAALIGRMAKKYEIDNEAKSQKLINEERFTYISDNKIGILETEIPKYQNKIKLISWNDWKDDYELAIILDEKGNKIEKYRLPTLYFK